MTERRELRLVNLHEPPRLVHPIITETAQEAFDRIRDALDQPDAMEDFRVCTIERPALWCPCGQLACLWVVNATQDYLDIQGGSYIHRVSILEWSMLKDRHAFLAVVHHLLDHRERAFKHSFEYESWLLKQFAGIGLRKHLS